MHDGESLVERTFDALREREPWLVHHGEHRSEKAREQLLSVPYVLVAVQMAYWRQVNGVLTEKN